MHNYERSGERLFSWRTPDGPPDQKEKWLSANSLIERWRLTNFIFSGQHPELRIPSLELGKQKIDARSFLAEWEQRTLPFQLSAQARNRILQFSGTNPDEGKLRMTVALMQMTPEAQWR